DTAAAFFKKVRQDSFVNNRNAVRRIGHREAHRQSVVIALQSSIFNQSADAKCLINRGLLCHNLAGAEKENQIVSEGAQYQPGRQPQRRETYADKNNSPVTFLHYLIESPVPGCALRRPSAVC